MSGNRFLIWNRWLLSALIALSGSNAASDVTETGDSIRPVTREAAEIVDEGGQQDGILVAESEIPPSPGAEPPSPEDLVQQRLSNLEAQLNSVRQSLELGTLAPGRLRSTDIAPNQKTSSAPTYPNAKLTGFFQMDAGYFGLPWTFAVSHIVWSKQSPHRSWSVRSASDETVTAAATQRMVFIGVKNRE